MFDFAKYAELFNNGDDVKLVETYMAEDFVYTGDRRVLPSRTAFLDFLKFAHDGVREIMRPQLVLQEKDRIFAEIDMDFHALKARQDYPFGELKSGEMITVKFFVVYKLRDGKIAELKSAIWPRNYGVSKAPRLGGSPGQRAAFQAYTRAFSEGEFEIFTAYYADDVILELGSVPPIHGKSDIIDYYRKMFQEVREDLKINRLVADDNGIAADFTARFTAIKDAPGFTVAPLKKGESVNLHVFVHYTLRNGLISHIQVARRGQPTKEPETE
jgi:predicted SnoaL-like aldol condensation-catalyzing enzyme